MGKKKTKKTSDSVSSINYSEYSKIIKYYKNQFSNNLKAKKPAKQSKAVKKETVKNEPNTQTPIKKQDIPDDVVPSKIDVPEIENYLVQEKKLDTLKDKPVSISNDGSKYVINEMESAQLNFEKNWKIITQLIKNRPDIEILTQVLQTKEVIAQLLKNRKEFKVLYEKGVNDELCLIDLTKKDALTNEELSAEALSRYKTLVEAFSHIEDNISKIIMASVFGREFTEIEEYIFAKNTYDFLQAQPQRKELANLQKRFPKQEEFQR